MSDLLFRCTACEWHGTEAQIDRVNDPKPGSTAIWNVCSRCRDAEQFVNMCDEPGCNNEAGCGWPSDNGYRRTCGEHIPIA